QIQAAYDGSGAKVRQPLAAAQGVAAANGGNIQGRSVGQADTGRTGNGTRRANRERPVIDDRPAGVGICGREDNGGIGAHLGEVVAIAVVTNDAADGARSG